MTWLIKASIRPQLQPGDRAFLVQIDPGPPQVLAVTLIRLEARDDELMVAVVRTHLGEEFSLTDMALFATRAEAEREATLRGLPS